VPDGLELPVGNVPYHGCDKLFHAHFHVVLVPILVEVPEGYVPNRRSPRSYFRRLRDVEWMYLPMYLIISLRLFIVSSSSHVETLGILVEEAVDE